jgi:hypothetical protein
MYLILLLNILVLLLWNIMQGIRIDKLELDMKRSNRELFDINKYLMNK